MPQPFYLFKNCERKDHAGCSGITWNEEHKQQAICACRCHYWWCQKCNREVSGFGVTYENIHEACGYLVFEKKPKECACANLPEPEKNIKALMEAARGAKATASPAACQRIDEALAPFEEKNNADIKTTTP